MGILDKIPDSENFLDTLSKIVGSEVDNSGLAGVLKHLNELDTPNLTSSLISLLDDTIASNISIDTKEFTGGIFAQFDQAKNFLPADPKELIGPLQEKLDSVRNLTSIDLSDKLLESIGSFQSIQSLIPADTRTLLSGAADGLIQLKGQFISGSWGELAQWSTSVQNLYDEISPLFEDGAGTIEERLISFFQDKISDLVKLILPQQQGFFEQLSTELDLAISTTRVTTLQTFKSDLIVHINNAEQEFKNGNFANNTHLAAAETTFQQLTDELSDITSKLNTALNKEIATAAGMGSALQKQLNDFKDIEIIDLGNIKDKFKEAIQFAEDALLGLKLNVVKDTVENVFDEINKVIDKFDISQLTKKLEELQQKIQTILDELEATLFEVIASIRNIFTQVKEALRSVFSALGSYDENGEFHFFIEQEIDTFLNEIKTTLNSDVKPILDEFKTTVDAALKKVNEILTPLKTEIETVKSNLIKTLTDVSDYLNGLDVPGELEKTRQSLDNMLSELGEIDFNPVVDPVIDQIDGMRDDLKEIDLSSLNDYLVSLLKVAVAVIKEIDFSGDITEFLLDKIDDILEIPENGLKEIEINVEDALAKLNQLEPGIILKPLGDLYDPVDDQLNAIQLQTLLAPLDNWHASLQQELDKLSPAALLQPVVDLYEQLKTSFASISPEALIQPLQEATDNFKSELQRLNVGSIADELNNVLTTVKNTMDELSPENFFTPLVNAFDKIETALDRFNPGDLLKPFTDIFDKLLAPLDNLNPEHVRLIGEAFAGFVALPTAFDPKYNFQMTKQKFTHVQTLLDQISVGQIISDLNAPYNSLKAAFEAGGGVPGSDLSNRVEKLNPIRNTTISQSATEFQKFETHLHESFSQTEPSNELVNEYNTLKPKLESLVPSWLKGDITPDSIKEALKKANPLNVAEEVNHLYEVFKEQLQNFNPRILQDNVKETYDNLKEPFSTLDPETMLSGVQGVLDNLNQKLNALDLQFMVQDLESLVEELDTVIKGMDPQQIIQQLEGLTDEVKDLFDHLKPSILLSELNVPFQTARDIIEAFDPLVFKEPLLGIFSSIQDIISKIDIGIILQPLNDRLEELRDELDEGLKRTETAFDGMIAAIPV